MTPTSAGVCGVASESAGSNPRQGERHRTNSLPGKAIRGQSQHLGDNSLIPTTEGQGRRVLLHTDLDTSPSQFLGRRLDLGDILGPTESNLTESSSASVEHKEH